MLAVAGALVVLRPDKMDLANGHPDETSAGICVMVLQTMCYAAFLVALKIKLQTHPYPFGLYAYASLVGVTIIATSGVATGTVFFDPKTVPRSAWLAVLYCGFVISFFAHACQSWYVLYNLSPSFRPFRPTVLNLSHHLTRSAFLPTQGGRAHLGIPSRPLQLPLPLPHGLSRLHIPGRENGLSKRYYRAIIKCLRSPGRHLFQNAIRGTHASYRGGPRGGCSQWGGCG